MSFRSATALLIIAVMFVAIFSQAQIEATRVLAEDFAGANHLATYPSVYNKAKYTMACWLERLASGPSPKGPGHWSNSPLAPWRVLRLLLPGGQAHSILVCHIGYKIKYFVFAFFCNFILYFYTCKKKYTNYIHMNKSNSLIQFFELLTYYP